MPFLRNIYCERNIHLFTNINNIYYLKSSFFRASATFSSEGRATHPKVVFYPAANALEVRRIKLRANKFLDEVV